MSPDRDELLRKLAHDVNSKCSSLKSAVGLLKESSPGEAAELLRLMKEQSESLSRILADCERRLR